MNRRKFSAALLSAAVFPRELLAALAEPARRPSLLLLPQDPFSGLTLLRARYEAGHLPSDDLPGWALSWQLTQKGDFAQRALTALPERKRAAGSHCE
jgi:hypothetical protein